MNQMTLVRFEFTSRSTLGRLYYPGGQCFTLENSWKWNTPRISCIPEGWYDCVRGSFRGLYENYEVLGVVGRSAIELHIGNTTEDTLGCILLGLSLQMDEDSETLQSSRLAFDAFMAAMEGIHEAVLVVTRDPLTRTRVPVQGGEVL